MKQFFTRLLRAFNLIHTLYFECHVTIEPVFDDRLILADKIARAYNFKIADLLMQKRRDDKPERSKYDTFMTARSKDFVKLNMDMVALISNLRNNGFTVWRYKIEDTIIDSKLMKK